MHCLMSIFSICVKFCGQSSRVWAICALLAFLVLFSPAVSLAQTHSLTLTWTDQADNEDGFLVYEQVNGGAFTALPALAADTETALLDRPLDDMMYCYQVTAFNTAGESGPSNTACITLYSSPPNAPTNLMVD